MDNIQERQLNQAAYRRLSDLIKKTYPTGRFVAISGGQIIADAASFDELRSTLDRMGLKSPEVLIVQAGIDYLESAVILAQGMRQ